MKSDEFLKKGRIFKGPVRGGRMGPPTGGMMEGLLVSNSPFLGDFLDPPLCGWNCETARTALWVGWEGRGGASYGPWRSGHITGLVSCDSRVRAGPTARSRKWCEFMVFSVNGAHC